MTNKLSAEALSDLITGFCNLETETEWVEFKKNNARPEEIGMYISALSNSAAIWEKESGYLVWGIDNKTHKVIGTKFSPTKTKIGNEEIENWLRCQLEPKIGLDFYRTEIKKKKVVILKIEHAYKYPIRFKDQEFIRVGSCLKKLKDHPELEKKLWNIFSYRPFEEDIAMENVSKEKVLELLDYFSYFNMRKIPVPEKKEIIEIFKAEKFIKLCDTNKWNITNLGAITFANNLADFDYLGKKIIKVIKYNGNDRTKTKNETLFSKGYACEFEELISKINGLLVPAEFINDKGIRELKTEFSILFIRELIANAIIHQDFLMKGTKLMVEIFDKRLEITNPGEPLVDKERFVDFTPISRNENLSSFMRRVGICEERGSGWDKIATEVETNHIPAPRIEIKKNCTRIISFYSSKMNSEDRIRSIYLHACLMYVNKQDMTNTTIRKRFEIDEKNMAAASRLIKDALDAKVIILYDEKAPPKLRRYVPYWALPEKEI